MKIKKSNKQYTIPVNRSSLTISMLHQIYIVKQMNACRDYNGNRGEQKHKVQLQLCSAKTWFAATKGIVSL